MDENAAEIEFYYDEVEKVCLYLAENLVKAKQVFNQFPILIKRLLDQFKDVVFQHSNDIGKTNILKHKINLVHPFPIMAKPKTFDLSM